MKEAMVTIRRKASNKFEGESKISKVWFNLDHKLLKRTFSTLEPYFHEKLYEKDIEGLDI